ncbi:MAG: hypothetical protein U5K79_05085 [Cyclobacteriaceae bacterium]|nr:hypothetical protein [Cyclobacteriaceae bacterium]
MKDQHVSILKGLNYPYKYLLTTAWRYVFLFAMLWLFVAVSNSALAQSNAPKKLKSEPQGELTRKYSEKVREKGSRGSLRRKNSAMQKSYYKKKSRESGYPGNIWIRSETKRFHRDKRTRRAKSGREKPESPEIKTGVFPGKLQSAAAKFWG